MRLGGEIRNVSPIVLKPLIGKIKKPLGWRIVKTLIHFATAIIIWELIVRKLF